MGRHKWTIEKGEKIVEYHGLGIPISRCCDAVGIHETTFNRWLKEATEDVARPGMAEWAQAMKACRVDREHKALSNVHGHKDWSSDKWWLQMMYPERYGDADKLKVDGALTLAEFLSDIDDDTSEGDKGPTKGTAPEDT